jgi:hypothetical protein
MAMGAMIQIGNTDGTLVAARLPRVAETPKPRPAGMATEYERNLKPRRKGKGTRKQRKEESMRWRRREISLGFFFKEAMSAADIAAKQGLISERYKDVFIRYGSKAHRRALAKLTQ